MVLDYAFSPHPSISALHSANIHYVGRYISESAANDANGKNLIPSENSALKAAGIGVVLFAEEGATDMLGGHSTGVQRAKHFQYVVNALGRPDAVMVCTADFDASPGEQAAINAYLSGAVSVLGIGHVGLYGGYYPVSRALNAGVIRRAVQTFAWSGFAVKASADFMDIAMQPSGDMTFVNLAGNSYTLMSQQDQDPSFTALSHDAAGLPPHAVLVTSVAGRNLPGTFLFDDRAGLRQGLQGSLGGVSVDFDQTMLPDFCQHPRPAPAPAPLPPGAHLTDGKTSLGEYAAQRNYQDAFTFLAHQEALNAGDAVKLANAAVPPAGLTWHTNP